jgi:hypothetical protein
MSPFRFILFVNVVPNRLPEEPIFNELLVVGTILVVTAVKSTLEVPPPPPPKLEPVVAV